MTPSATLDKRCANTKISYKTFTFKVGLDEADEDDDEDDEDEDDEDGECEEEVYGLLLSKSFTKLDRR
jgi:hypothetical protein